MPNFAGLLRAPTLFRWEVMLERKRSLNEAQNARKVRRQVHATDEAGARVAAVKGYPEFIATTVRKITP